MVIKKLAISNTHRLYWFSFFRMSIMVLPVLVPFFQSYGLNMHQIFLLQAIFGVGILFLEIPTGYISDLFGRKRALILGAFFCGLGFTYLCFAKTFWEMVIYEIILSFAFSFISGSDIAIIYDSFGKDQRHEAARSLANMQFAMVAGEAVSSIVGGIIVLSGYELLIRANAVVLWIPFILVWFIHEPPSEKMHRQKHWDNFKEVFHHIFKSGDEILFYSFFNLLVWSWSSFFIVWIMQKYWGDMGIALAMFGPLWAIYNISAGFIGQRVQNWEKRWGPKALLKSLALFSFLGYFGMALFGLAPKGHWLGYLGVASGFFFPIVRGITQVQLKDAVNWRIPAKFRSTANSVQSFFFRLGFAVLGPGLGMLLDKRGAPLCLTIIGLVFVLLTWFVLRPLLKRLPT